MRAGPALFTFVLVGSAIVAACAGPAPGKSSFASDTVSSEGSSGKSIGDDDDDDATSSSSTTSGAPAGDLVFGASTFKYINPGQNANDHLATHTGKTPLEGQDCMVTGCHLDAKPWGFAGTVYSKVDGTTTVAEAEVGVVYGDTAKTAMTDQQGNFWLPTADVPPTGAKVGVRKAGSATKIMNTPLPAAPAGGACNSTTCHGSPTLRIYIE